MKLPDQETPAPTGRNYADAFATAFSKRRRELSKAEELWKNDVTEFLDQLVLVAKDRLDGEHLAAASLKIEMQRDLFEYMPFIALSRGENNAPEINPLEPSRVYDDLLATAHFLEWLLFRKANINAERIATIIDNSSLKARTANYAGELRRIEAEIRALLNSARSLRSWNTNDTEVNPTGHLRLV
ncbi:MAG: hypothetical protein CL563_08560 [Alphaproteobacteria bacterium]|nr:hypothetical protein [Alphaproteobacteria bacterium]